MLLSINGAPAGNIDRVRAAVAKADKTVAVLIPGAMATKSLCRCAWVEIDPCRMKDRILRVRFFFPAFIDLKQKYLNK